MERVVLSSQNTQHRESNVFRCAGTLAARILHRSSKAAALGPQIKNYDFRLTFLIRNPRSEA